MNYKLLPKNINIQPQMIMIKMPVWIIKIIIEGSVKRSHACDACDMSTSRTSGKKVRTLGSRNGMRQSRRRVKQMKVGSS